MVGDWSTWRPRLVQLAGEARGHLTVQSYLMGRKWGQTLPRGAQGRPGVMGMSSRGGTSQTLPCHTPRWPSRCRKLLFFLSTLQVMKAVSNTISCSISLTTRAGFPSFP